MNNFMPNNLTTALYNQATLHHQPARYNYDINLSAVNKSMNEYEKNNTNIHNRIYQVNNASGVG
jgi:hypothetical protein